jgi:glutaconate CoA-transferase subunit A
MVNHSNKLLSMQEAVAKYTWDGMTYAHGSAYPVGADSIAFGREMVKQGRKNLNMISHCGSQQINLLAAVGAVRRVEVAFSGLEVYGFANGLGRMVTSGKTIIEDYSNGAMAWRFFGGAMNWPFVPATVGIWSDQEWCSADYPDEYPCKRKIPEVIDPFTGRRIGAFSSLRPEFASIHVTMADIRGNAIMMGSEWNRFEMSRAAQKVVLVAENIVDTACMKQYPNLVRIIEEVVDAVVYWPFCAWPAASPGCYDSDEEHMYYMNDCLKTEEGTDDYVKKYVTSYNTREEFRRVIGEEKIKKITNTQTDFLIDPYRKWFKSDKEIQELEKEAREGK